MTPFLIKKVYTYIRHRPHTQVESLSLLLDMTSLETVIGWIPTGFNIGDVVPTTSGPTRFERQQMERYERNIECDILKLLL